MHRYLAMCLRDAQANFAEVSRDMAKKWRELSHKDWKKYKCKCKRSSKHAS